MTKERKGTGMSFWLAEEEAPLNITREQFEAAMPKTDTPLKVPVLFGTGGETKLDKGESYEQGHRTT